MDIHKFGEISIEELKSAHIADKSIQDQYGVKYHQFWVNKEAGMVFCLMEGPDKETCALVHQLAHGNVACNVVEVEPGFFKLFMGDGLPVEHGMVQNDYGSADPGYRHILVIDILGIGYIARSDDYKSLWVPLHSKNLVLNSIARFKGRVIERLGDDSLVGIFNTAINAVRCAKDIQHELLEHMKKSPDDQDWNIQFRMGLSTGHPLTETGGFFSEALTIARRLCLSAKENGVLVSSLISEVCTLEDISPLRALSPSEDAFVHNLFELTESNLPNKSFNVDHLSRAMGVSRPQLYRKTLSLTGRSPIDLISALRMVKAMSLMKSNFGNVSEIALEVGYHNPSYFAKCFQKNFGCPPSEFMRVRGFS
jgi:AraC-like DNA-binding protein